MRSPSSRPRRKSAALATRGPSSRPGLDGITGFLIPLCIIGMIGSVVYFLIALRATFMSGGEGTLRYVAFWFVLASVGIGVIRRQYGSDLIAGPYLAALGAVMAVFILVFSTAFGSMSGQEGGSLGLQLLSNYALVGMIWWAANAITADCTLEAEDVEDAPASPAPVTGNADAGAADQPTSISAPPAPPNNIAQWGGQAARRPAPPQGRRRVGRSVVLFTVPVLLTFAVGQRVLAGAGRERDGHALACMVVYLLCTMSLLALTSLSGLRLYLRLRKVPLPRVILSLWLGLSALCIGVVLLGAGALPRTYGGAAGPIRSARAAGYLGQSWRWMERLPFRGDSRPTRSPSPGETGHRVVQADQPTAILTDDPHAPGVLGRRGPAVSAEGGQLAGGTAAGAGSGRSGPQGQSPQGSEGTEGQTPSPEATGQPQQGDTPEPRQPGGGSPPPDSAAGEMAATSPPAQQGGGRPEGGASAIEGPTQPSAEAQPNPAEPVDGTTAQESTPEAAATTETGAPVRSDAPPQDPPASPDLRSLLPLLLALLAAGIAYAVLRTGVVRKVVAWLARLRLPAIRWHGRSAAEAEALPGDPFADPTLPAVQQIERAYAGLLAYADALGCPRRPQETPIEYGKRLPAPLHVVRGDAARLTRLYVMATYGGQEMGETHVAEARASWERIRTLLEPRLTG